MAVGVVGEQGFNERKLSGGLRVAPDQVMGHSGLKTK